MELLTKQVSVFESIKTLCTNYKKDSATRKTIEYLDLRLNTLEKLWVDFHETHETLVQSIEDKSEINYFTTNVYGKIKELYETTKENIMELMISHRKKQKKDEEEKVLTSIDFDVSGISDNAYSDNTTLPTENSKLLSRQNWNFKALERAMLKINLELLTEKWEIEDLLSNLQVKWDAIDKFHWQLEDVLKGTNLYADYSKTFENTEQEYDNLRKQLKNKLWANKHYQQSAPKIEIPDFSGNYINWISFKDLFLETIHKNPTIPKAQKMQHLKTKLKGEAERLVQHLTIRADNYDSCWDILSHRYDNRRLQFTAFMNAMHQLPVIRYPNTENLKKLHDVVTESLNGLTNMGVDSSSWGPMIVYYMTQKLDSETFTDYSKDIHNNRELPDLAEFLSFLENKFMALETAKSHQKDATSNQKPSGNQNFNKPTNKFHPTHNFNKKHTFGNKSTLFRDNKEYSSAFYTTYGNCPLCDGKHVLMQCKQFTDMSIPMRNQTVAKLKVCKNCLYSHGNATCSSTKTCKECNLKHHSLLHMAKRSYEPTKTETTSSRPQPSTFQQSSHHLTTANTEVLLTTVKIKVRAIDGTYITLRGLLDQGSQVNLITENAVQLLRLPRTKLSGTVSGVGSASGDCKGRVQLTCKSIHNDFTFETEALILKKLTNNLPNSTFERGNWPHLENLKLGDPDYNVRGSIDFLLSADVYSQILMEGFLKGNENSPVAQQTQLGWILCGKLQTFNCHVALVDLTEISKYWENEDILQGAADINKNDYCETYYRKTTTRLSTDGKYVVKMPMLPNFEAELGKSRHIAVSQFLQQKKRLTKYEKLATMYKSFMNEYSELEHMKPSSQTTEAGESPECYLPHHGVLRENATTTKLRVVFNASSKTSSGKSLNALMEKGPNLQKDIQALILKWRSYKYAFTADIEKMYRYIWISEDQQQLQKIIWRPSTQDALQEYTLCTLTYGAKCAPWLAMRTLKQLAIDDGHKYPAAANVLQNEFYVDDLTSGHNTLEGATELQTTLIKLLKGGGMNLRKWSSNCPELLKNLTEDQIANCNYDFKHENSQKTLGLGWDPHSDTFTFNWNLEEKEKQLTKRALLSEISQLYDPLGWFSPITVTAKQIFQRVWEENNLTGWDQLLPADIQKDWLKLRAEIPEMKNVKIKRWIGSTEQNIQLLGFCDASEKAYSCVIYTRVTDKNGQPVLNLFAAKTRVAPLTQKITLPRKELCGALLLSQLMDKVRESLPEHNITMHAWTDSKVVLAWLQGESTKWEKYVENRVKKIKQVIPAKQWNYIETKNNPADCATRGVEPKKLLTLGLWWNGPTQLTTITKPSEQENMNCLFTTDIEKQKETTLQPSENNNLINNLINKHSSLVRTKRIVAWIKRFITKARTAAAKSDTAHSDNTITTYLTTGELLAANTLIMQFMQRSEFQTEYSLLKKKQPVNKKSSLFKLNPYLDEDGIIRVGGRLNKTNLPLGMKNPVILPRKGRWTELVIDEAHAATLHGGARLTLAYIRQRYWIIGGNRVVKAQLRRCVRCLRYKTTKNYQIMADLPRQRAIPSRPFTHTGVDFTGHVNIKLNKGRGVKTSRGYIAIFVCSATKAVDLQLVSDLSAGSFLLALQRLCAKRGTPKHMYSDCGTNFIGASRILKNEYELFKTELSPEFFDEIGKMEIEWHFNAPAWPTAGGLWEAAVRSMKHHLRRVLGDQKLTYEELATLLSKIEACMNSRPLCPLTEDPEDFYNYLTPGHFLTGSPTLTLPLSSYEDEKSIHLRERWQLTQHMLHQFWVSWMSEYLSQLQARSKWQAATKNLEKGDIVLIKENNIPPGKWAIGKVIELHPGQDGHVRVTTIKTQNGLLKRPITKLAKILPFVAES